MSNSDITIKGAREHNLQNVDVRLPRNRLICLTGVSGSGKSSLAFDTLYAEGQRRYVESLSSFARHFLGQMPKPDVDQITGLSPSISISQKSTSQNPRSTVGTITEINDYLRVLFARTSLGHCPQCGRPITAQSREQIIDRILALDPGTNYSVLAPVIRGQKGEFRDLFDDFIKQGFVRARVDGQVVALGDDQNLDRQMRHNVEIVIDRLTVDPKTRTRLAEAVELAIRIGGGNLIVAIEEQKTPAAKKSRSRKNVTAKAGGDLLLSADYACTDCGLSFEPPSPQMFSFNSPQGMCPDCDGLGERYSFDPGRLIPDPSLSFKKGCFELIGSWRNLGRWWRHIYQGVADSLEYQHQLDEGILLETPWEDLDPRWQRAWLDGTGDAHITFTWRSGRAVHKYGGNFDGIVPTLLSKYRNNKSRMRRRQLEKYMRVLGCSTCGGQRLNAQARAATLTTRSPNFADQAQQSLADVGALAISDAAEFFTELEFDETRQRIAAELLKEIRARLSFLINVGLDYLTLGRRAPTLSGGESQRIRLAGQIGSGLVGVTYILDEPSIGLHPTDNDRLLDTLRRLRDLGNTVIVVEHDEDTMRAADELIDFGPGPGVRGGHVVATGTAKDLAAKKESITGQYLAGKLAIDVPATRRAAGEHHLRIIGAAQNNLQKIDVDIPLGTFVCVTGVSGSGKSSLVGDILVEALRRDLNGGLGAPGEHERIEGLEHLDKLIAIDQSPIGRTPRSNPATYIKVFDDIRKLYAQLPDAKARGYKPGRFSFNVAGGRCEACEGNGSNRLEMDFLADIWVTCPVCEGHRFNRETLQVRFKDKSIADVLEMDIQQALDHFENIPAVHAKLKTLHDVGLDYLKLGQPSPTLSGGEAQRIKLARELVKKSTGQTLYLLDEPTTGLHFADIQMLLDVLHGFVDAGNTVLVVEHNQDVIKTADWIIDLGPAGGAGGGRLIAAGTPEDVARTKTSRTGRGLAAALKTGTRRKPTRSSAKPTRAAKKVSAATAITVQGAQQHNLKKIDVEIPRQMMTVCCGVSGSGKSSLAMDTVYAEGQRRYVESLGSYARQFVSQMPKPRVDHITGLSPAIAIEQKRMASTPRSTVGTVTEIYDYLRILYARLGIPYCPTCDVPVGTQSADEVIDKVMALATGTRLYLTAPLAIRVGERYETLWEEMRRDGYVRMRVDGRTYTLDEPPAIDRRRKHDVEVIVDRVTVRPGARSRIADSTERALSAGRGVMRACHVDENRDESRWQVDVFSQHYACESCGRSYDPLTPHSFSFNSSLGWCEACEGLGIQHGARPDALLQDTGMTLAEGAVSLWPDLDSAMSQAMLTALSEQTGIPLDVSFSELAAQKRRIVLHGLDDEWIDVPVAGSTASRRKAKTPAVWFRYQWKGLYPALAEASRRSTRFRGRLEELVGEVECSACAGSRLRPDASAVRFRERTLDQLCHLPVGKLHAEANAWKLTRRDRTVAGELVREVQNRLQFLVDVGLEYLTLSRPAPTLSGGESQRIRLASQVGSGLTGVLYVLDEPTIGLHPRDNDRLIRALAKLRDLGNTLLLVEHDREVIARADQLLDFGPRAGEQGGTIVAHGTPKAVAGRRGSVTGPYLSGDKAIAVPTNRRLPPANGKTKNGASTKAKRDTALLPSVDWLEIRGARHNNLKNVDVSIPLSAFTVIAGVSGSGKSSLIDDVLYNALARRLHRASTSPAAHDEIIGVQHINKVIRVDQQPLGNTPNSNPATYTGVFELIRQLFAQLPESKLRGYSPRRFSFNVPGGRCDACEGNGQICVEMHFLPDVWVECDTCHGRRYNPETLAVTYRGQNIADVLEMSCARAVELFRNIPKIRRILQTLCDVGLEYLTLGQPAPTLSGGEAQRVKLAAELSRPDTGNTLYLLDEPTTGLHFEDLRKLLDVLNRLVDLGNTVVVIEHNLDVIKTADWIIDVGPEAGDAGGQIVAAGTPEDVAAQSRRRASKASGRSYTGQLLVDLLKAGPHEKRKFYDAAAEEQAQSDDLDIKDVGAEAQMPWQHQGRRWHTRDRTARNGQRCRWDGEILARLVDHVHETGPFARTNWNHRTIVEVTAERKTDGWFLHAITGDAWLLQLKFRVRRNTFQADELIEKLDLVPLNERPELPVYGSQPRVQCKNLRGPWQEIQLKVHDLAEVDKPAFWDFVDVAVNSFQSFTERKEKRPDDVMPWKVLGRRWHLSRKGFPPGKRVDWDVDVLEKLCGLLGKTAPDAEFQWDQQQVVHLRVPSQDDPWVSVYTKRRAGLDLTLFGPKGKFVLGRVANFGTARQVQSDKNGKDVLKIKFNRVDQVKDGEFARFLREHLASVGRAETDVPRAKAATA